MGCKEIRHIIGVASHVSGKVNLTSVGIRASYGSIALGSCSIGDALP